MKAENTQKMQVRLVKFKAKEKSEEKRYQEKVENEEKSLRKQNLTMKELSSVKK